MRSTRRILRTWLWIRLTYPLFPLQITPTAHFSNDLGLDSLDTVEVVMAVEEEFSIEIPDKDADTIHSGKPPALLPQEGQGY